MWTAQLVVQIVLIVVTVARAPIAIGKSSARPVWFASLAGCCALFTRGQIVSQDVIDAALGGTNVINLLQNSLAVLAFWLITRAAIARGSERARSTPTGWDLIGMVLAFSIPFFFIDRGSTSYTFIADHADELAMCLYASIYMACVVYLMVRLLRGVRGRTAGPYWLFRGGATSIAIASIAEIIYLVLAYSNSPATWLRDFAYAFFAPPFYLGIALLALGIASFTLIRWCRELVLLVSIRLLTKIQQRHQLPSRTVLVKARTAMALHLASQIADAVIAGTITLTRLERFLVAATDRVLNQHLTGGAAGGFRMSATPGHLL